MPEIELYFSTLSTWSYVGAKALRDLQARHSVNVLHLPVNLLTIFQATGGLPAGQRPTQRQAWRKIEMRRWRAKRGLAMNLDPAHWPFNPRLADGIVAILSEDGEHAKAALIADKIMCAVWEEERNLADPAVLASIASELDLPGEQLVDLASSEKISGVIASNTERAIEKGVFGAPTYFVGEEMFWGQDRLDMLDEYLSEG